MIPENAHVLVKSGDIVTLSYENSSRSLVPINPTITRIRLDMSWRDAVRNYRTTQLNGMRRLNENEKGRWNGNRRKELKQITVLGVLINP